VERAYRETNAMTALKLCFISPKSYPLFNPKLNNVFGGMEVQLFLLAHDFAKNKNLDVNYIVADYGQESSEYYSGVKVIKSFKLIDKPFVKSIRFLRCFLSVNAEVYIQRSLDPKSGIIVFLCKLLRKRFIYMVAHDGETDGTHEVYKSKINSFFAELVFKYSDLIITQNEYEYNNLRRKFQKANLYTIKKGINFENIIFSNKSKEYDVVWVGRCEKWKNPQVYLRLAQKNTDKKFLMICPPATNKKKYFEEIHEKAKKIKNIDFYGLLPNSKVYTYLLKSKVFCITSDQEGDWPMVVLESLAHKLPILSYKLNYGTLLKENNCGFYCNNDFDTMIKRLNQLLNDINLYKQMSENAYQYAKENHDIVKNANRLYMLIRGSK
jgi:glycosyltransferase involved in cell wall biosynthesis